MVIQLYWQIFIALVSIPLPLSWGAYPISHFLVFSYASSIIEKRHGMFYLLHSRLLIHQLPHLIPVAIDKPESRNSQRETHSYSFPVVPSLRRSVVPSCCRFYQAFTKLFPKERKPPFGQTATFSRAIELLLPG